ncbi:hypothetical protein SAMN05518845_12835 [Variovorax sp. YR750]|nr:hypothetical protein SAMN05518845_12835 [Variovorax sp. YR750]
MRSLRRITPLVVVVLAGCGGSHMPDDEQADFGASVVARGVIAAQQKCDAVGMPDLYECAEAPSSPTGERMAARVALGMYRTFQQSCYETAGAGKCEALVEAAYRKAKAQESSTLETGIKKPPEGG